MNHSAMESFVTGICMILVIVFLFVCLYFILSAFGIFKVLRIYRYPNCWMAFVPYLRFYALADAALYGQKYVELLGCSIPVFCFKFWFLLQILVGLIPGLGLYLGLAIQIFGLGYVCGEVYQRIGHELKSNAEAMGYLSGWLPVIMTAKFLNYHES